MVERFPGQFHQSVDGALIEVRDEVPVRARSTFPTPVALVPLSTCGVRDETRVGISVTKLSEFLGLQMFLDGGNHGESVCLH